MGAVVECYPPRVDDVAVLPLNSLPLGFRFRPTDEELIDYYLRQKINGNGDDVWVIQEIDVCKWEPWDLPDLSIIRSKDPEWFFFCPQDRKYPNGHRLNRATTHGYWKATGKDRKIKSGSSLIGMKKTLVFYTGRAPRGKRTNWVMHEYRPTLKELDGTNPGQRPYVLCRLFKKQDETLEGSNCGEADRTVSTPTTGNYSPEEILSDLALIAASPSLATEDDKNRAVPVCISDNSEEATSNIITPNDCNSEECDTYDVQDKICIPTMAEEDQLLNYLDGFYDPTTEPLDDKLFSPEHVHIPPEFYFPASNESDNCCGLQQQYGTNDVAEFLNSVVNWDDLSYDSSCQKATSTLIDVKDNGSGSESDVEMSNTPSLEALRAAYPEEAIDRRASLKLETSPQFYRTATSDLIGDEQKSSILLQNYNSVVSADNGTGIKRRTRQEWNDSPNKNLVDQGTAPRRIRLQRKLQVQPLNSNEVVNTGSCAPEDHDSKPIIAEETKASGNHAIDAKVVDEPQKTCPDSTNITKISQQHAASACSISKLRDFLLCTRLRYTSKASSNSTMWPTFVFSVIVIILLVFLANIWGYLKF